jgi:predicted HAD superfamily Cof-like phosphohydrolase
MGKIDLAGHDEATIRRKVHLGNLGKIINLI